MCESSFAVLGIFVLGFAVLGIIGVPAELLPVYLRIKRAVAVGGGVLAVAAGVLYGGHCSILRPPCGQKKKPHLIISQLRQL